MCSVLEPCYQYLIRTFTPELFHGYGWTDVSINQTLIQNFMLLASFSFPNTNLLNSKTSSRRLNRHSISHIFIHFLSFNSIINLHVIQSSPFNYSTAKDASSQIYHLKILPNVIFQNLNRVAGTAPCQQYKSTKNRKSRLGYHLVLSLMCMALKFT